MNERGKQRVESRARNPPFSHTGSISNLHSWNVDLKKYLPRHWMRLPGPLIPVLPLPEINNVVVQRLRRRRRQFLPEFFSCRLSFAHPRSLKRMICATDPTSIRQIRDAGVCAKKYFGFISVSFPRVAFWRSKSFLF